MTQLSSHDIKFNAVSKMVPLLLSGLSENGSSLRNIVLKWKLGLISNNEEALFIREKALRMQNIQSAMETMQTTSIHCNGE